MASCAGRVPRRTSCRDDIYGGRLFVDIQAIATDATLPLHRALEEAVYANPDLLSDFGSTTVLVDTEAYTIVPEDIDLSADELAEITHIGQDTDAGLAAFADTPASGARVVWTMHSDASNFLARTFRNAPMLHSMTMLLRYFGRQDCMSNRAKVFVHLSEGTPAEST